MLHDHLLGYVGRISRLGQLLLFTLVLICIATPLQAQMVSGAKIPGFIDTFGITDAKAAGYTVQQIESSIPSNILWPDDKVTFTLQINNISNAPLVKTGKVDLIAYGTKGRPGDVWVPDMYKLSDAISVLIDVNIPAKGFVNVKVTPEIPAKFGAYALIVDLGDAGRLFATTCVRTFAPNPQKIQYPCLSLDYISADVLKRLGVRAVRMELGYTPTSDKNFDAYYNKLAGQFKELHDANITVLFMTGGGAFYGDLQPMERPRPHLAENGQMLPTKFDLAPNPKYDDDFQKFVKKFSADFGWPKGPVTAFSLWNEPWEGISISGWGADMLRYREIYTRMALGVEQARKEDGVDVLVGGCDSSSNAQDKLFADGKDDYLKWFDFLSVHYQGMDSHATIKKWVDRQGPNGRVKIWDTESWVANTDDRVAAVIACNRAAGYDRAMGVFGGNIANLYDVTARTADGKSTRYKQTNAWSVAASVGATTHFIGERPFKEILFKNGLPWVFCFDGEKAADGTTNPEDGTIVVVGDLGEEFGSDLFLFRTARGFAENAHKVELKKQLAALSADAPAKDRETLEKAISSPEILSNARMTLPDGGGKYNLYDFYGNPVPAKDGKIIVPLDGRGFFLRGNGEKDSFTQLVEAVKTSRIDGIEPFATVCHDMTSTVDKQPIMRLSLTNVLNRPITGKLNITIGNLKLEVPATVSLLGNETQDVNIKIVGGEATVDNNYPLILSIDSGADGITTHEEMMHINVIAKREIVVDGKLDDWKGVLPQTIISQGIQQPTLMESAWLPFVKYDNTFKKGIASGFMAYDKDNFYFAAKIADDSPEGGMVRVANRDDSYYFYPEHSFDIKKDVINKSEQKWSRSQTDIRSLQRVADDAKDRSGLYWTPFDGYMSFDVDPTDGKPRQLSIYTIDIDRRTRYEKIQIVNPDTAEILDEQSVTDFGEGKYLSWTIRRKVTVRVWTLNKTLPATVQGIFIDVAPPIAASATGLPPVSFLKVDINTQGNWKGVYGAECYTIVGDIQKWSDAVKLNVPDKIDQRFDYTWPEGVRRFSYRRRPDLPAGNAPNHDNVQLAFNVIPAEKKDWYTCPPGTMPGFTYYKDTDYEYALNPIAPVYGGGTEIWRLQYPDMPHKHFYPRQPKSPLDGPAKDGKLVTTHEENMRVVECALPWAEIPNVKKALDAGQTIKFSFRVNDNKGVGCMELAKGRSVAKRNGSFTVDWTEHWANEVEFGFEK
jgi:hypothetical protein